MSGFAATSVFMVFDHRERQLGEQSLFAPPRYSLPSDSPQLISEYGGEARALVIYGGSCSSCSLKSIDIEQLPYSTFSRIFIVYDGAPTPDILRRAIAHPGLTLQSELHRRPLARYAPAWVGQWFVFKRGVLSGYARTFDEVVAL